MGSGSKIFDQGQINFCCWGRVSHLWFGFCKISLKNTKFFNFFLLGSKKISLGQVKKYPDQKRVSLLYTVSQKYAWVGSGPISTVE